MREIFPKKKAGDSLSAGHINTLGEVARRVADPVQGSHGQGWDGKTAGLIPTFIRTLVIVEPNDEEKRLYKAFPLYYDQDDESWSTDTEEELEVDSAGLDIDLADDDIINAYYHKQRGRWIPLVDVCPDRNEIHHLTVLGGPTGGTFTAEYTIGGITEILTFAYDATATTVQEIFEEEHSGVQEGDVEVTGGPFPNATIQIEFKENLEATAIPLPLLDWDDLTGGAGVAVIGSRPQSGFPN